MIFKVFYVIDSFAIGGAQTQLLELLRRLDRAKYEAMICPVWPLMELEEEYRQTGAQIIKIPRKSHWDLLFPWRLARRMREFRPHIVHAWLFTGNLWGHLAASLARVPVVLMGLRSVAKKGIMPVYYTWAHSLLHILAGSVDAIITNSQAQSADPGFPGWKGSEKLRIIYNGVDLRRFNPENGFSWKQRYGNELGLKPGAVVLGTIGRLSPEKRQDRLLQAVRILVDAGYDLAAVLVGNGPLQADLEGLAVELKLQNRVFFLGPRRDIPELLSLFDIFVLSSDWEGFPNVILEAMAMSRPVVATEVGGVGELVVHGETGSLVAAGEPQLLADAIRGLIDNPVLATRMGLEGRLRVEENFSLERMVADTTNLYEELLLRKGMIS